MSLMGRASWGPRRARRVVLTVGGLIFAVQGLSHLAGRPDPFFASIGISWGNAAWGLLCLGVGARWLYDAFQGRNQSN